MNVTETINEAVTDYFEIHCGRLERLASRIHAYNDVDAMEAATTNETLRSVFEDIAVDLKEDVEVLADFNTREVLYDLRHEHADDAHMFGWTDVYKAIWDAANERAAEME